MIKSATIQSAGNIVTVLLDAVQMSENKLSCRIDCEPNLKATTGDIYSKELIRVLCGSGLAFARRKLSLTYGLEVFVFEVTGILDRSDEVGVCHATSLAIARALEKDDAPLLDSMPAWSVLN